MRHVVLGSKTGIGTEIIKMLIGLEGFEIVACSPDGELPVGIPVAAAHPARADIHDPYSLYEVLREGDIVYNTQVILDDFSKISDLEFTNTGGLVNLLGISLVRNLGRIITIAPAALGWEVPSLASEQDNQEDPSPYHQVQKRVLDIIEKYRENQDFGWNIDDLEEWVLSVDEPDKYKELIEQRSTVEEFISEVEELDELDEDEPSPSVSTPPSLGSPSLEDKPSDASPDIAEVDKNDNGKQKYAPSPVIIARIGRIFGPYDTGLTPEICRKVRLERAEVIGPIDSPISWITPEEIARALAIMSDPRVPAETYFLKSFDASLLEIYNKLAEMNYSNISIIHKDVRNEKIKYYVCRILEKIKICHTLPAASYRLFNHKQTISTDLAETTFQWSTRTSMEKTCKQALNWYIYHYLK